MDYADEYLDAVARTAADLRQRSGLSQERIADRMGGHRNFVGQFERHERRPTLASFVRLAASLGETPSALLAATEKGLTRKLPTVEELDRGQPTAPTGQQAEDSPRQPRRRTDVLTTIERLQALRASGALTDDEFGQLKARALADA